MMVAFHQLIDKSPPTNFETLNDLRMLFLPLPLFLLLRFHFVLGKLQLGSQ